MLFSYNKPHNQIYIETSGRWLKEVLNKAGNKYNLVHILSDFHFSAAKTMTISVGAILDVAGWSSSEAFAKFYDKSIISELRLLSFEGP